MLLVVAVVAAAEPGSAQASFRSLSGSYIGGSPGDVLAAEIESSNPGQAPVRVGGIRVAVWPEETLLVASLQDSAGSIAVRWLALGTSGAPIANGRFCNNATIAVPANAGEVWLLPSYHPLECRGSAPRGGTFTARLSPSFHTYPRDPLPNDGWVHGLDRTDACAILLHDVGDADDDRTTRVCHTTDLRPSGPDPPTEIGFQGCNAGLGGTVRGLGLAAGACATVVATPPTTPPIGSPGFQSCPDWGVIVTWLNGAAGACGDAGLRAELGECEPQCIWYSLTQCGPYQFDPTVYVFGLTVWACGTVVTDPPNLPGLGTPGLSICPGVGGATVTYGGGAVGACVQRTTSADLGWLQDIEGPSVRPCTSGSGADAGVLGVRTAVCRS